MEFLSIEKDNLVTINIATLYVFLVHGVELVYKVARDSALKASKPGCRFSWRIQLCSFAAGYFESRKNFK